MARKGVQMQRFGKFLISEYNERLLSNCRAKKMYEIVNKHIDYLIPQYTGTCKSAYTKEDALICVLTVQGGQMIVSLPKRSDFTMS